MHSTQQAGDPRSVREVGERAEPDNVSGVRHGTEKLYRALAKRLYVLHTCTNP